MIVFQHDGEPRGYETISATTASVGFTKTFYNYAATSATVQNAASMPMKVALVTVEVAAVRFTVDGTTPTVLAGTAAGHQLNPGDSYVVRGYEACRNFRAINDVASNGAILHCTYFY
jgi:hypothetical protein